MSGVDPHLAVLIRRGRDALERGDQVGARLNAIFAGGEIERMARETGGAVAWPDGLAEEPLKGWAEYGVTLARRGREEKSKAPSELKLRFGGNHAAHAVGAD